MVSRKQSRNKDWPTRVNDLNITFKIIKQHKDPIQNLLLAIDKIQMLEPNEHIQTKKSLLPAWLAELTVALEQAHGSKAWIPIFFKVMQVIINIWYVKTINTEQSQKIQDLLTQLYDIQSLVKPPQTLFD